MRNATIRGAAPSIIERTHISSICSSFQQEHAMLFSTISSQRRHSENRRVEHGAKANDSPVARRISSVVETNVSLSQTTTLWAESSVGNYGPAHREVATHSGSTRNGGASSSGTENLGKRRLLSRMGLGSVAALSLNGIIDPIKTRKPSRCLVPLASTPMGRTAERFEALTVSA